MYTVVKVGGGTGQGPATEVTHLRLNQHPFLFHRITQSLAHETTSILLCSLMGQTPVERLYG